MNIVSNIELANFFQEKSKINSSKSLLGIDFGMKNFGFSAYSSKSAIAFPQKSFTYDKNIYFNILNLIEEKNVIGLVIGLPIHLDGSNSEGVNDIREFVMKFFRYCKNINYKNELLITFYDERLTTAMANKIMRNAGIKRKDRNSNDHSIAANIILSDFVKKFLSMSNHI